MAYKKRGRPSKRDIAQKEREARKQAHLLEIRGTDHDHTDMPSETNTNAQHDSADTSDAFDMQESINESPQPHDKDSPSHSQDPEEHMDTNDNTNDINALMEEDTEERYLVPKGIIIVATLFVISLIVFVIVGTIERPALERDNLQLNNTNKALYLYTKKFDAKRCITSMTCEKLFNNTYSVSQVTEPGMESSCMEFSAITLQELGCASTTSYGCPQEAPYIYSAGCFARCPGGWRPEREVSAHEFDSIRDKDGSYRGSLIQCINEDLIAKQRSNMSRAQGGK